MSRKICVVTGTRAEYGLLQSVIEEIKQSKQLELQLIVTGMHLSTEFGMTYKDIENDNVTIDRKIEMLLSSDSAIGISKSMGLGLIGISESFEQLKPDLVLVLGDRFEILSAVTAAMLAQIPIAHISGGETTEGAFDESIRHSITKMSHIHFVTAGEYQKRVIQLGENPRRVFIVGALGVDNIQNTKLLDINALQDSLGFKLAKRNLLITFHPVTLDDVPSETQLQELLLALDDFDCADMQLIFTMPNADTNSRILFSMINDFVSSHSNAHSFVSLGRLRYLSCLKYIDAVIGNSSSGLTEAPYLGIGTINIGDRQLGRIKESSVIDCEPKKSSILNALNVLYSNDFKHLLGSMNLEVPLEKVSKKIVRVLSEFPLHGIIKKSFYDIEYTIKNEND